MFVKINILINWATIINCFMDFSVILLPLKLTRNQIYTAPAAQRLSLSFRKKMALNLLDWHYVYIQIVHMQEIFYPLEVVGSVTKTQLQVGKKYII